jgi:tetratricopeptide (TPR) repeat protein
MSSYQVAHFSEVQVMDDGRCPLRPIRHHFGITTFGVTTWTASAAGDRLINEHDESDLGQEELYLVLEGRARFELDGETVGAGPGTFVYAPAAVKRTAFAEEAGTTLVAMGGGAPGQPYVVQGWEIWAPMMRLFQAGEHAQAADWVTERLDSGELEESATLFYNLACAESLAGRHQEAIAHLARAIEMDEQFRAFAAKDSDFDPVRDRPEFGALVGGSG